MEERERAMREAANEIDESLHKLGFAVTAVEVALGVQPSTFFVGEEDVQKAQGEIDLRVASIHELTASLGKRVERLIDMRDRQSALAAALAPWEPGFDYSPQEGWKVRAWPEVVGGTPQWGLSIVEAYGDPTRQVAGGHRSGPVLRYAYYQAMLLPREWEGDTVEQGLAAAALAEEALLEQARATLEHLRGVLELGGTCVNHECERFEYRGQEEDACDRCGQRLYASDQKTPFGTARDALLEYDRAQVTA
jgi:hypothetical protein